MSMDGEPTASGAPDLVHRHVRVGWLALLVFLAGGIALEALHGFKVDAYLGVDNETRKHLWTLAHAHGTLLGLVNLAFAWTLTRAPGLRSPERGPWPLAA